MSSPKSATDEDTRGKPVEQITFRFCSECSNMLYPKQDDNSHRLQFTCRTCHYTEEAQSSCVFRNVMNNAAGETAGVTQDVGSDPTEFCALAVPIYKCAHDELRDDTRLPGPYPTACYRKTLLSHAECYGFNMDDVPKRSFLSSNCAKLLRALTCILPRHLFTDLRVLSAALTTTNASDVVPYI